MPSPALESRDVLTSVDLHRLDQAAWILAHKDPVVDADGLLAAAAAAVQSRGGRSRADHVLALIAAMIDRSAATTRSEDLAREDRAARGLAGLQVVLAGAPELSLLQQALRRGRLEGPLALPAARRLRRALRRALRDVALRDADIEPLRGLAAAVWHSLLDALARSLALDVDDEILTDVALNVPPGQRPAGRLAQVRALLSRDPTAAGGTVQVGPGEPTPRGDGEGAGEAVGPGDPPAFGRRIGRFVVLHRIGAGAMGVVYAAFDDQLDRKVAIKLLRPQSPRDSGRAQVRLLREAQAMARLSHPNVAVVHDVGSEGAAVYVAMEFIRGMTVQTWLSGKPRPWREIVDVFLQAGRGLAAAHAAGLVHRDFKPSNVMIGADGRVRVLDFGLCSTGGDESGEHQAPDRQAEPATAPKVTQGGEVVGTPAYMPPEQFSGRVVGPASDQFAFCVSLYEALYGALPFPGETVHELAHAVARGDVRDPPRGTGVPAWLHAIVLRGLRPNARDRYPSMDALLRSLDRSHALRRRTYGAGLAFAAVAALAGFFVAKVQDDRGDPCDGGREQIEAVWDDARRSAVGRALIAAGPAFADEVWPRVSTTLDVYAREWTAQHRDACLAQRRGDQPPALFERRVACLAQRRTALSEAATLLSERDPNVALHALELVARLPALARCGDAAVLAAEAPLPSDPAVAARVDSLQQRLVRVTTLDRAGRPRNAIELADRVVAEAEELGQGSIIARALIERARLSLNLTTARDHEAARLQRAVNAAIAAGDDEAAAEAMAMLLFVRGGTPGQAARALEDLPLAEALVARLPQPDRLRLRGTLLNNAGVVSASAGDLAHAKQFLAEALQIKQDNFGGANLEVAYTLTNLAMSAETLAERADGMGRALGIFAAELGPAHVQTIEARIAASLYTLDPPTARGLLRPGCDALARFSPGASAQRARCLTYLAHHCAEAGDDDTSRALLAQAALQLAQAPVEEVEPTDRALIRGYAALGAGEHRAAADELRSALAETRGDDWWRRRARAELSLALGLHLRALQDRAAAEEALASAIDGFVGVAANARDALREQRLARARVALADLLLERPDADAAARARAQGLLDQASRWYREAGDAYAWRLEEINSIAQRLRDPRRRP